MPDALPDTTLHIYPGMGLALGLHWLVTWLFVLLVRCEVPNFLV